MSSKPNRLLNVPENNIAEVKQKPSTPPTTSPMKLTTHIGTPPEWNGSTKARVLCHDVTLEFPLADDLTD